MKTNIESRKFRFLSCKNLKQHKEITTTLRMHHKSVKFGEGNTKKDIVVICANPQQYCTFSVLDKHLEAFDIGERNADDTTHPLIYALPKIFSKSQLPLTELDKNSLHNISGENFLDILVIVDTLLTLGAWTNKILPYLIKHQSALNQRGVEIINALLALKNAGINISNYTIPLLDIICKNGGSVRHFNTALAKGKIIPSMVPDVFDALQKTPALKSTKTSEFQALFFPGKNSRPPSTQKLNLGSRKQIKPLSQKALHNLCWRYICLTLLFHDYSGQNNIHYNINHLVILTEQELVAAIYILKNTTVNAANKLIAFDQHCLNYVMEHHNRILTPAYAKNIVALFATLAANDISLLENMSLILQLHLQDIINVNKFVKLYSGDTSRLPENIFQLICKYARHLTDNKHAFLISCISIMAKNNIPLASYFFFQDNLARLIKLEPKILQRITIILKTLSEVGCLSNNVFNHILYDPNRLSKKASAVRDIFNAVVPAIAPAKLSDNIIKEILKLDEKRLVRLKDKLQPNPSINAHTQLPKRLDPIPEKLSSKLSINALIQLINQSKEEEELGIRAHSKAK